MTRDDIIRMAKEAGFNQILATNTGADVWIDDGFYVEELWHFAALVAAEKDKEIERLQDMLYELLGELTALRAEKQMRGYIKQLKDSAAETTIDVSGTEEEQPR